MPPRDPKLCPALERAHPADRSPGTVRVLDWPERWEAEFGERDDSGAAVWRVIRVRARAEDRDGAEVVLAEWVAEGATWQDWLIADSRLMRPA